MRRTLNLWTKCTVLTLAVLPSAQAAPALPLTLPNLIWQATDGGEGGESGALPESYRLRLDPASMPKYDASAVQESYVALALARYAKAAATSEALNLAIHELLEKPEQASLDRARKAWSSAHAAYLTTEVFRYYGSPIDAAKSAEVRAGPEPQINAWPLNEAAIDYVKGNAKAGLVNELKTPITRQNILKRDQVSDEADVTTGFHALEFLLWGQDLSADTAGQRPASDFVAGKAANERRRAYLKELGLMLSEDLRFVVKEWDPIRQVSFGRTFVALDGYEAVGRILRGMAMLVGEELASERLSVALDSQSQEDEASCFSDTTHLDFQANLDGVYSAWRGELNGVEAASVRSLLSKVNPVSAKAVDDALRTAMDAAKALDAPFDQTLNSPPDDPRRIRAESLVSALQALTKAFKQAGRDLAVLVSVPGV